VPEDPKWGKGPPLKPKEKKVLKERLQVLSEEPWRQQYIDLMLRYHDVCSKDKFNLGCTEVIEHSIVMEDERPVHQRQFRVPFAHEEGLYEYVDKLLKSGAIKVNRSPYNSAVFCVAKKQLPNAAPGDPVPLRVVLDFRAVNLKSFLDCFCVKEVRERLDEVGEARSAIFSTFDLTSGFWQQSLQEKSRQYTAFSVPGKGARYQWRVTTMGLQGSSVLFARLMDFVMTGVKGIITYIDDILVHSQDHEQHLKSIQEVLWRLQKYGLKLNVDKTIIGARTVQYLGYTLSGQGVMLSKDKLAAIKDFPMPMSPKTVREFLGLANYFRSLIPRFSQTADPLNKMTRASTVWRTGAPPPPEAQAAFNKLMEALMSAPIVVNPNREGRFILQTDASSGTESAAGGMGSVLLQEQNDKMERVVAYASRGLKDHKKNYPAFLLEKVAACWGIDYFDTYLTPPKQFTALYRPQAARDHVNRPQENAQ
jgi:hypothetical protein